jgi:hypothetical protein
MTQDIIRMAREAGWTGPEDNAVYVLMLKRLIELARAAERGACLDAMLKSVDKAVDTAMALEREACAKLCEAQGEYGDEQYAAAIRARSQA